MAKQKKHEEREKSGLEERVLHINRCSKVVKGGRKFSFSALILVGDGEGRVGFGFAKANELADAIRKGSELGRKNLINFAREKGTIPHEVHVKSDGTVLMLKPAKEGTGIVAGSLVRSVLELAKVGDVVAKLHGSNNPINQVKVIFKALKQLRTREEILSERGLNEAVA